jgi:hypothetical protein
VCKHAGNPLTSGETTIYRYTSNITHGGTTKHIRLIHSVIVVYIFFQILSISNWYLLIPEASKDIFSLAKSGIPRPLYSFFKN